jgi:hypothetical protein
LSTRAVALPLLDLNPPLHAGSASAVDLNES